ncbi:MAG: hypothetical protein CBC24_05210 [Candidatus Pelagibacter sp. TMED64]|nr:hypothetical protein [Candidatus Pelagibacter sp.]OUU65524.1 MAG: hypothetical protein CBC24_05210 [Candidatus Pelagibacter sp. TMED64]|tara:strand:+ start:4750 stop:5352 length:603 start_codon:yes stop_codon:yes gene_type:complete
MYHFKRFHKKNITLIILLILSTLFLQNCKLPKWDPGDARKIDANADVRARQAIEEGRSVAVENIFKKDGGVFQFSSSNVLWRAALETLDFLPLANVDYAGGMIITDWYNDASATNESIKITVRFLSNEIRSDGINVSIHKKICNESNICSTSKVSSSLEKEIKDTILKLATKLQKTTYAKNSKKTKKKKGDHAQRIREKN